MRSTSAASKAASASGRVLRLGGQSSIPEPHRDGSGPAGNNNAAEARHVLFIMMAPRLTVALGVACVLAGTSSSAFAQGGMAGMDHGKHRMGPEIVIPKGALYTKADVEFMQGMIAHHAQAIVMSRMAESHGANPQVLKLSNKIDQSQLPEILIMQNWLRRNNQFAPDTSSWHHMMM